MAASMTAEIDSPWEMPSASSSPVSSPQIEFPNLQKVSLPRMRPSSIRVPDMFSSILSAKVVMNPHYLAVKEDGDRFIGDFMDWDEKARDKNSKADFACMVAIWSPDTDPESLRVMLDWAYWVFLLDDQFDEGHLKADLAAAQAELAAYTAIIDGTAGRYTADAKECALKLRYLFQTCCDRIRTTDTGRTTDWEFSGSTEMVKRFMEQHHRYFAGLLFQVEQQASGKALTRSVDEYIKMRRGTIGAYPAIALTEWSEGIELGSEPFHHPSLQQCMIIITDLIWLCNDIVSFRKDLMLGVDHNFISLLMEQGLSMQEAVDRIGDMMNDCYRRWYLALAELPVLGEAVDHEALRFVNVCRNVALGNHHWGFKTGRYWGVEGDELRRTRTMHLPPQE